MKVKAPSFFDMKYSILGFNQSEVMKLSTNIVDSNGEEKQVSLDVDDLLILSVIAELSELSNTKIFVIDNKRYCFISYNTILNELPILKIGKKQLSRKLAKLEALNLIELRIERIKDIGTMTLFMVSENYYNLRAI